MLKKYISMTVSEFLSKCNISEKDKNICLKVYGDQEKTEASWKKELTGRVVFSLKSEGKNKIKK